MDVGRRSAVLGAALTSLSRPPTSDLLSSSRIYAVSTDSARFKPALNRLSTSSLVRILRNKQAIYLGEHHPDFRDHLLQAALLRRIRGERGDRPLAVGLEMVQRQFQTALDDYVARRIDEQQLFAATDWAKRWYWPFEGYAPVLRLCRDMNVPLVALDVDGEDKGKVELGGLAALDDAKLHGYIPDLAGFEQFGRTRAYEDYLEYTLRPPFTLQTKLGQKMTMSTSAARSMSWPNYVARQSLRDEAMAGASAGWLAQNPGGQMLNLVGVSHAKFGLGVQARTARMLGSPRAVASVLLNPTPINTFGGAEINNLRPCDRTAVPNEACVLNDIEVQNYVLQLPITGGSVLPLSNYFIFSPS